MIWHQLVYSHNFFLSRETGFEEANSWSFKLMTKMPAFFTNADRVRPEPATTLTQLSHVVDVPSSICQASGSDKIPRGTRRGAFRYNVVPNPICPAKISNPDHWQGTQKKLKSKRTEKKK